MKARCEEQARLALAAVAAINRVHDAKKALDEARKRKLNTKPYEIALYDAQTVEQSVVAALESHKKEHKCWGIGLPRSVHERLSSLITQSNGTWMFSGRFTGDPIADYLL